MTEPPTAVAIIHARGGSKRVPGKNVRLLGGKPLVAWIIEAARASSTLSRVIVSTDDDAIKAAALAAGAEVPFRRPADISEDVASELVTQHAVRFLEEQERCAVDIAVTLQPTTPFCRGADIDACVRLLIETGADSVVSMREVRERPEWMFRIGQDGRAASLMNLIVGGDTGVWQKLPKLVTPNGGIYATRRDVLMEQGLIFGKDTRAHVMPLELSYDIDEPIDFVVAETMARELAGTA